MVLAPLPLRSTYVHCLPLSLMHLQKWPKMAQTGTVLSGEQVCLLLLGSGFPQGPGGEPFWKIKIKRTSTFVLNKCHLLLCKGCALSNERPKWHRTSSEQESLERLVMCRSDVLILLGLC